jgi:hypothetical protein
MNRFRRALEEPSFGVVVFLLGALALGWPLVSVAVARGVTGFFVYLFGVWGLLVLLALIMALTGDRNPPR